MKEKTRRARERGDEGERREKIERGEKGRDSRSEETGRDRDGAWFIGRRTTRAKGARGYLMKGGKGGKWRGRRSRKTVCVLFEGERILYKV